MHLSWWWINDDVVDDFCDLVNCLCWTIWNTWKMVLKTLIFKSSKLLMKFRSILSKSISKPISNDSQENFLFDHEAQKNSKVLNSKSSQFIVKNIIWRFAYLYKNIINTRHFQYELLLHCQSNPFISTKLRDNFLFLFLWILRIFPFESFVFGSSLWGLFVKDVYKRVIF